MTNKKYFIFIIIFIITIFIVNFIVSKEYNKSENVEKRAIEYCIKKNYEYRETTSSDGLKLKQCKINDKFIDVIEFYKRYKK